ncbi:MAG: hypothetical protein L6R41_000512 [Letrouitia leprolyta]|nr:MAG: hypothetical protein L6R41_000512 [Letrouitia leprolyta]
MLQQKFTIPSSLFEEVIWVNGLHLDGDYLFRHVLLAPALLELLESGLRVTYQQSVNVQSFLSSPDHNNVPGCPCPGGGAASLVAWPDDFAISAFALAFSSALLRVSAG